MGYPIEFAAVVPIVKKVLKQKNMTYRDLARRMNMSEANVKKIMAAKDCSLNRLNRICEVLELSPFDLLELLRQDPIRKVELDPRHQEFLASEEVNLLLYFKVAFEGIALERARQQLHLNENLFWKKIRKMESLGLLVSRPDGSLKTPEEHVGIFSGDGPVVRLLCDQWMMAVIKDANRKHRAKQAIGFGLRYFRLGEKSANEFREKLSALIADYDRISNIEAKIHDHSGQLKDISLAYAVIPDTLSNIRQRHLDPA